MSSAASKRPGWRFSLRLAVAVAGFFALVVGAIYFGSGVLLERALVREEAALVLDRQEDIRLAWEDAGAFRAGRPERAAAPAYCIVIPPPNVTGSLHMGHALNNTLQDILCRFERMRGRDVLWQPHLLDHPNGVIALRDIFLCVDDAGSVAAKYGTLFDASPVRNTDDEWRITLARGSVWISSSADMVMRIVRCAPATIRIAVSTTSAGGTVRII